ncbi:uncharacterized protein LOC121938661 [Plectropomus leopardus]|uniref:uncharacterized protein LOC121938661 n=1 Tax=Plectropomus leopardus TaxID=160734 RepID=UPI001C4C9D00|nr:uncharacterized protein LOC121938661 [Plectropomus leopardus]
MWAWQRNSGPSERVNGYSVTLRKDSERQTLSLWPDQRQHTFLNLKPNTEYSLLLLADNVSRSFISVRTDFDEVPVVAAATPLLLLAVTVFIVSILSRTLYKSYFFPLISSPRGSTAGQWLMDPNHLKTAEKTILDIKDFQVTDILGEKSLITVDPCFSGEDLHEDAPPLSISLLTNRLSSLELDAEYISDAPVLTEHPLLSLPSCPDKYPVDRNHPNSREVDVALLHQTHEALSCFSQKKEESDENADLSEPSHPRETALKYPFRDLMANGDRVYQMACEDDYLVNSTFLGKTEV